MTGTAIFFLIYFSLGFVFSAVYHAKFQKPYSESWFETVLSFFECMLLWPVVSVWFRD